MPSQQQHGQSREIVNPIFAENLEALAAVTLTKPLLRSDEDCIPSSTPINIRGRRTTEKITTFLTTKGRHHKCEP